MEKVKNKKPVSRDFLLKINSVLLAVVIWFTLAITMYPTIEKTIDDIKVKIDLEGSYAQSQGLSPIDYEEIEIEAKISGMRYEIGNFSEQDLVALVDISTVRDAGVYELPIKITAKDNTDLEVKSVSQDTVKVRFDYIKTQTFTLEASAPNVSAANGYMIDEITVSPETVTITAPLEDINRITKVVARSNSTNVLTQSTSIANAQIILYDGSTVLDNFNYEFNRTSFNIEAKVYSKKTVPLYFDYVEIPTGFDTTTLEYMLSDESITIAAPTSLDKIDSWHLGYVAIKDIKPGEDIEFEIDLPSEYVNISKTDKVTLSFDSSKWATKTIGITKSQMFVINGPSKFSYEIQTGGISHITVVGPADVLDTLTVNDFIGEVNLNGVGVSEGVESYDMTIYSPDNDNVWCVGEYTCAILATDITKVDEPEIDGKEE